jgi:uncharacterized protein with NRDE domain
MCLIFLALKRHPLYKFVLAGNRDEFYKRRTAPASFWPEHTDIVGGRDLEAGGTWLAMRSNGRIGMVTNYRDPKNIDPNAPSRGHLVSRYLETAIPVSEYVEQLQPAAKNYNGFNLLVGNPDELWYLSNYKNGFEVLREGTYGLSNHLLETPWPKVKRGKENFGKILASESVTEETLFNMLFDDMRAEDDQLPDTGIGLDRERALSAMFIKSPGYGTRCSTVILVDNNNNVSFKERVYNIEDFSYSTNHFEFEISPS